MEGHGLYRIKNGWRNGEASAILGSRSGLTVEISEHDYRDLGYRPAFDDLPWRESDEAETVRVIGQKL
jgi:hypothetical protein